jgi:hypothetical protein
MVGRGGKVHLGFPDPAATEGDDAAKMQIFRQVHDVIREEILEFLTEWEHKSHKQPLEFVAEII